MDTCSCCGETLNERGVCLNVECSRAQEQATKAATRTTAKSSVLAAAGSAPQAWQSTGRVD